MKKVPDDTRKKLAARGYMVQSGYVMKYLPVPPNCLYIPEFTDGQSIMSYVSLLVNLPGKLVLPTDLIVWCPIRFVSGYFNSFVEEGASKDRADKKIKIWFPKFRVTWWWIVWSTTCYWKIHPSKGHYKGMWQGLDVDDLNIVHMDSGKQSPNLLNHYNYTKPCSFAVPSCVDRYLVPLVFISDQPFNF